MSRQTNLPALAAVALGLAGCASQFDAVDRSATALAQRLENDGWCASRPAPNDQTTVECSLWEKTVTTSTSTTTDADGKVTTTTSTTRTVNGQPVPERR